jgi:hypothetical protein
MAYSDFTLQEVVQRFQLVLEEQHNLFAAVPDIIPGDFLCAILDENVPLALALSTEKARSELMIAPVLVEVPRHVDTQDHAWEKRTWRREYWRPCHCSPHV